MNITRQGVDSLLLPTDAPGRHRGLLHPEWNDEPVPAAWAKTSQEVLQTLESTASGLSGDEVTRRQALYGPNSLRQLGARPAWRIAAAQFRSLLVLLLAAAAVAALAFGEWVEAAAIVAVLFINALLGFITELKAARSVEALRKMGNARATVRRNGRAGVVLAAELVPGDIVLLEGGDVVTADLRLISASKLQANESALTGESLPTEKSVAPVAADAAIASRASMLFKGTIVTRGAAEAVVVATGMASELGQISRLVEEAREEVTPIERRLNRLGHGLIWLTLVVAGLVALLGYWAGHSGFLIIETAIALAVAAVPEGLPIIATIALARGMHRMARHNALVNRLSAVETLGTTSVICTDKTGTLTENRMRVERVVADDDALEHRALELGALCNNAELGTAEGVGDPMEIALLAAAAEKGVTRDELVASAPERREVAFDPEVKMMATIHGNDAPYRVAVKGAPEAVIAASTLSHDQRERWLGESERLAQLGLRVLALAEKEVERIDAPVFEDLHLAGLIAMFDPPRAGVRQAIEACRRAGVRVVMVTGDHPATARNIAVATGLLEERERGSEVLLGHDIEAIREGSRDDRPRVLGAPIFARVSPRQKLDLIAMHQSAGEVVAMTGDGVNDAPALRKADIGVAMGIQGTDAAREAAAMVLRDDDLSTLGVAIAEGRAIFDNIRSFALYLLSCNLSEVLVVAMAAVAQLPLPILPLQILFLNLVTDVFPALALGVGEGADDVMRRSPRPASEPVVTRRHWLAIARHGLTMTAAVLAALIIALEGLGLPVREANTVSFLTLALTQLWHVFNMRRPRSRIACNEITRNPWVWAALALCVAIVMVAIYVPPLASVLSLSRPGGSAWLLILGMSAMPLVVGQIVLAVAGRRSPEPR